MFTRTESNELQIELEIEHLYVQAYLKGWLRRLTAILSRRPHRLLDLTMATAPDIVPQQRANGVQPITLRQICGSVTPEAAFDRDFNPLQPQLTRRWRQIATAMYQGLTLPAVELYRVGECYFVRDGHYRISVARALRQEYIDAVVMVWQVEDRLHQPVSASAGV